MKKGEELCVPFHIIYVQFYFFSMLSLKPVVHLSQEYNEELQLSSSHRQARKMKVFNATVLQ